MTILIAYFAFVVSTLAVIVTAWIGVAESGAERLHLQRASAIQHSYDASFMADDSGDTASTPATTGTVKAKAPQAATMANAKPRHWRAAHVARRVPSQSGPRFAADPRVALRGLPPPDDGH